MIRKLLEYPATISASSCLLVLASLFWVTGALWPTELPDYASSRRQITGMSLMLILLPGYLLAAGFHLHRRSLETIDQLEPSLPAEGYAEAARKAIRGALSKALAVGSVFGIGMGFFNTQLGYALFESSTPRIDITITLGQILLWWMVGVVLTERLIVARGFDHLGEVIPFDLFQLDRLRLFARSGLNDVLVIAGAVAFSSLQSLDAEFRWYNYSFALMIAISASLTLLVLPLRRLHRRIVQERTRQLARAEALIDAASVGENREDLARFEALLAHRERLRDQQTWPFSTALVSRVVAYLIIPPIAWAGAALVERLVTQWADR